MLAAALLALPQSPTAPNAVRLVQSFEEGAVIAVSLDQTSSSEVVSESEVPIEDGVRQEDQGWFSGSSGATSKFELAIQFEDTFEKVSDGRVRSLVRRFEELAGESVYVIPLEDEEDETIEAELSSPLEGRAVRFAWDEDAEVYARSFLEEGDDEQVDAVLLEDQRIDAFGDWFLPLADEAEVDVGDAWELDPERWNSFLTMGGDFWIDVADADPPDEEGAEDHRDFEGQLAENGEGEIECSLAEVVEVDGRQIAVIHFEGAVDTHAEQDHVEEDEGTRHKLAVRVEYEMKIEGACRWDVAAGRALGVETRITMTMTTTEISVALEDGLDRLEPIAMEYVTVEDTVTEVLATFEERGR